MGFDAATEEHVKSDAIGVLGELVGDEEFLGAGAALIVAKFDAGTTSVLGLKPVAESGLELVLNLLLVRTHDYEVVVLIPAGGAAGQQGYDDEQRPQHGKSCHGSDSSAQNTG